VALGFFVGEAVALLLLTSVTVIAHRAPSLRGR
jgi:hypothetical protein